MKDIGCEADYQYAHDHKDNFVELEYMHADISGVKFYEPVDNPSELKITEKMRSLWKDKYGY